MATLDPQQLQNLLNQQNMLMQRVEAQERNMQELRQANSTLMAANNQLQQQQTSVLSTLPDVLEKLSKTMDRRDHAPQLIDPKGLGRPFVLNDTNAESSFRMWGIKLGDFVISVLGDKFGEAMQWSLDNDVQVTADSLYNAYGGGADHLDQIEDVDSKNSQFFRALRNVTEGTPFNTIDNVEDGNGLEAWRQLHRKYDPNHGGIKSSMLNALLRPERVTYENLGGALERWKALKTRYEAKKDENGIRETLSDSISRNSLEKLVPKELESHLQMNARRLKTILDYEQEIQMFVEAKTGAKIKITTDFSKDPSYQGHAPMDVSALIQAVSLGKDLNSFIAKGKGKGGGKGGGKHGKIGGGRDTQKFTGSCNNCGKTGHKEADCWQKKGKGSGKDGGKNGKYGGGKGTPKFNGTCNHCGKTGHKEADCWQKKGGSKGGKGKKGDKNANSLEAGGEPEAEVSTLDLCHLTGTWEEFSLCSVETKKKTWLKLNYDTGAGLTAFPKTYKEIAAEDGKGSSYRTASGEKIPDYGGVKLQTLDEKGNARKISGRCTEVHKVLASASQLHKRHDAYLWNGGGMLVPTDSGLAQALRQEFDRLIRWYGAKDCLNLYEENGVYNFYLQVDLDDDTDTNDDKKDLQAVETSSGGSRLSSRR